MTPRFTNRGGPSPSQRMGRVELPMDHPLALALRPSTATLKRIEQMERSMVAGWHAVRNMPLGSDVAQ
jgi:hypothetical protein